MNFTEIEDKEQKNKTVKLTELDASAKLKESVTVNSKIIEYNRRIRKNPNDISLWLEFVNFQDELEGSKNKRKLIERKISILKKAIELNFDINLILKHLRLAAEIEDLSTLMKLWEGYLKKTSESFYTSDKSETSRLTDFCGSNYSNRSNELFILLNEYLNFRQTRFLAFNFEEVNEAFSSIFKLLKRDEQVQVQVSRLIPLYLSYFNFLKRCGFSERIVSLFQVLIEVNIEKYNYGQVDLEAYEDQYEIMEHIGDEDYFVIEQCYDGGGLATEDGSIFDSQLLKWIKLEKYREFMFWHPKNSFDLEGQVIFDDLRDFIIIIDTSRDDILSFIKAILLSLDGIFPDCPFGFHQWFVNVFKSLLPFYKNDWEFVFNLFKALNPIEADSFTKIILSENRESLEIFFAYGRFQEFLGNHEMASKVYESLRKRTLKFDQQIGKSEFNTRIESLKKLEFKTENLKEEVYQLVRSNPGDKNLYMKIIEAIEPLDHYVAMEIFNLIDEQQLRLLSFLEEV